MSQEEEKTTLADGPVPLLGTMVFAVVQVARQQNDDSDDIEDDDDTEEPENMLCVLSGSFLGLANASAVDENPSVPAVYIEHDQLLIPVPKMVMLEIAGKKRYALPIAADMVFSTVERAEKACRDLTPPSEKPWRPSDREYKQYLHDIGAN